MRNSLVIKNTENVASLEINSLIVGLDNYKDLIWYAGWRKRRAQVWDDVAKVESLA